MCLKSSFLTFFYYLFFVHLIWHLYLLHQELLIIRLKFHFMIYVIIIMNALLAFYLFNYLNLTIIIVNLFYHLYANCLAIFIKTILPMIYLWKLHYPEVKQILSLFLFKNLYHSNHNHLHHISHYFMHLIFRISSLNIYNQECF